MCMLAHAGVGRPVLYLDKSIAGSGRASLPQDLATKALASKRAFEDEHADVLGVVFNQARALSPSSAHARTPLLGMHALGCCDTAMR